MKINNGGSIEPIRTVKEWLNVSGIEMDDSSSFVNVYKNLQAKKVTTLSTKGVQKSSFTEEMQTRFDLAGNIACNRRGFIAALISNRYPVFQRIDELNQMKTIIPEFAEQNADMLISFKLTDIDESQMNGENVQTLLDELYQLIKFKIIVREISLQMNPSRCKTAISHLIEKEDNQLLGCLKYFGYRSVEHYEDVLLKRIIRRMNKMNLNQNKDSWNKFNHDIYSLRQASKCAARNDFKNDTSLFYDFNDADKQYDNFSKMFRVINEDGSFSKACAFKYYSQNGETVSGAFSYARKTK